MGTRSPSLDLATTHTHTCAQEGDRRERVVIILICGFVNLSLSELGGLDHEDAVARDIHSQVISEEAKVLPEPQVSDCNVTRQADLLPVLTTPPISKEVNISYLSLSLSSLCVCVCVCVVCV